MTKSLFTHFGDETTFSTLKNFHQINNNKLDRFVASYELKTIQDRDSLSPNPNFTILPRSLIVQVLSEKRTQLKHSLLPLRALLKQRTRKRGRERVCGIGCLFEWDWERERERERLWCWFSFVTWSLYGRCLPVELRVSEISISQASWHLHPLLKCHFAKLGHSRLKY